MGITGENYEIWLEGVERPTYPKTAIPQETEYVIIGGGITGVVAAYMLSKENKKVVLFEKGRLGEWVTDCTTGFLTGEIDTDPIKLVQQYGIEKAGLILASHREAIDIVEKIIQEEHIECEFKRCPNYMYANNSHEEKRLLKIITVLKKLGVNAEYKNDGALGFSKFGYVEMPDQGKFHVMKYMTALAQIAHTRGAIIAENTEVASVTNDKNGLLVKIKDNAVIQAKKVISATYEPFGKLKELSEKTSMYRSYVLEYTLPINALPEATYCDELDPYHYFRIDHQNNFDRMIIGGEDNLAVIRSDRELSLNRIRIYTDKLLAGYEHTETRHWSGLILNSLDGLAYIGESHGGNIFYAFAFCGNGMTYSHIAGKILLDAINKKENKYADIYNTDRKISWWTKLLL